MNSKELLEQAEQMIAEAEKIKALVVSASTLEQLMIEVQRPINDICIGELSEETNISGAIGPELNARLKIIVSESLGCFLLEKNKELEKLLGIRKPATINPEFEAATRDMFNSVKKPEQLIINPEFEKTAQEMDQSAEPDPVEQTLAAIIQKTEQQIKGGPVPEDKSLGKYPAHKDNRVKTPENMVKEDVIRMYVNENKNRKQIAAHYGVKESTVNNLLFLHDITKRKDKSDKPKAETETERP